MSSFGERLRAVMREEGVSGRELGRRLGQSDPGRSVRRWTNSRNMPRLETVYAIAKALGVPPARLLEDATVSAPGAAPETMAAAAEPRRGSRRSRRSSAAS